MKQIFLVCLAGCLFALPLEAKKTEGKIIYDTDTVDAIIKIPVKFFSRQPNYESLQYKVKYYDSKGNKFILKPHEAKEVQFTYLGNDVRLLSRYNSLNLGNLFSISDHIFLRLEIDGNLKLFNYYYTQNTPGTYNASSGTMNPGYAYSVENYIFQKGEGELKRTNTMNFRKDMTEYFSDCPLLVEQIENKTFKRNDLISIVRFYNKECE